MNFSRGEYVSTLPQGEETVRSSIEALRAEVEQVIPPTELLALAMLLTALGAVSLPAAGDGRESP